MLALAALAVLGAADMLGAVIRATLVQLETPEAMRGRVQIASTPGRGTTIRMVLPLTLAIIDGMLIACGTEHYIIPSLAIIESLQPPADMLFTRAKRDEFLNVRGELLPLHRLGRLFRIDDAQTDPMRAVAVVVESMGRKLALLVDEVIAQQQVVIKPLGAEVASPEFFSGAAILSNGRVGLILNVDRIGGLVERGGSASPLGRGTQETTP
ncbi:MAG: chemotaxis protein CheW [Deltaproteobacteria bacterium]